MAKKYDLVVVVGTYVDRNGNNKKQYKTVGAVFENERGMYAVLDKTFNPAGVPDNCYLNFYEPRQNNPQQGQRQPQNQQSGFNDFQDDDLPF